jgi:GxxExxY protein
VSQSNPRIHHFTACGCFFWKADEWDKKDEGDRVMDDNLSELVIGCAFTVANTLGVGFLEKVYENALAHEMRTRGLTVVQQRSIVVTYNDIVVGEYITDLLVEDRIMIELKVVKALSDQHVAQCMNYLRATGKSLCLLFNFGRSRIELRRVTVRT